MSLTRYAELKMEMAEIQDEIRQIEEVLAKQVEQSGQISEAGFTARFKAGRSRTDHEAAAKAAKVPAEVIEKFTTTKSSIAWAKVTKVAGCNTADFTVQGAPVFVIEAAREFKEK